MALGFGSNTRNNLLLLLFNATAWANIAQNGVSPLTNLDVSLNTADPSSGATMNTNETSYTSYARVSVARTSGGWTVSGASVSPVSAITFPACTGSTATITHFCIGKTGGGATDILFCGTVTPNISVSSGVTPQLTTGTTVTLT
jgi:hypothetical protein